MKKRPTNKNQPSANEQSKDNQNPEPEQFELLPPPPFNPTWPASNTLPAETLARLLSGERLTQPAFGTSRWRLAAYVMELKYFGWPVKSAPVHHPGRARPIAQYWLDNKTIMAVRAMRGAC
ncbi:hypothetical protein ABZO35_04615 [Burkholderia pseudomallei]|uniref:hypothetical protein n=1 Tax=Burkholderia pseudomallei TaxID=28450 RepID=UPI00344E0C2A